MMRYKLLGVVVLLVATNVCVQAQDIVQAELVANSNTYLVGEPISLSLTIRVPANTTIRLPDFPAEWSPFVVQNVGEVMMTSSAGVDIYQQSITALLWRPGDYQTPDIFLDYQLPGSDTDQTILIQAAQVLVQSVLNPDDLTLRPLKPPITMPYISPWLIGAILMGLSAAAIYGWKLSQRWKRSRLVPVEIDGLHPSARSILNELRLMSREHYTPSRIYLATGNVLRGYVQTRFFIHAQEMTTEELLVGLRQRIDISERRQRELLYLFEQIDLVKFADLQPQSKSAAKMLDITQRWVVAVEQDQVDAVE